MALGYAAYFAVRHDPAPPYVTAPRYQYPRDEPAPVRTFDVTALTFAGEPVPLHDPDVYERLDRELHINTYWHSSTLLMMKRAHRWFPRIEQILRQHNLPDDFKYVVPIESMFDNLVSPRGAAGFWQLMEETARELGLEVNDEVDERFHPIKATHAACRLLRQTRAQCGSYTNTLAAYNRGVNGFVRAMQNQQQASYYDLLLNPETSRYIFRVLAAKEVLEHPRKYGFRVARHHLYQPEAVREITVRESIPDLVVYARTLGYSYKTLVQYNPWLRGTSLTLKEGKTYTLELPLVAPAEEAVTDSAVVPVVADSLPTVVRHDSLRPRLAMDTLQPGQPDTLARPTVPARLVSTQRD